MKKYFLFIPLLVIVFLGLGNVVMGQVDITNSTTPGAGVGDSWETQDPGYTAPGYNNTEDVIDCDDPNLPQYQKLFCDCNIQPEFRDVIGDDMSYVQFKGDGNGCCVIEAGENIFNNILPVCTSADQNEGEDCVPIKANAQVNAFGRCVCNEDYKDVDGECKSCSAPGVCCGIELNTKVPFIGNCIESKKEYIGGSETGVTGAEAFPTLMGALTQILVTIILIVSFVLIVVGGVMIATGNPSGGKKMIMKVVIGIALLGASGIILRLINPNFFG